MGVKASFKVGLKWVKGGMTHTLLSPHFKTGFNSRTGSVNSAIGVPILAGGFTFWIVEWDYYTIGLSDGGYRTVILFCYRKIGISNIVLANSRYYRTIGYRIKASIYWNIGYRTQKKLSVAHLCLIEYISDFLELSVSLVDVPELCPKDPKKVSPCISHPREEFLCIKQKQTQALAWGVWLIIGANSVMRYGMFPNEVNKGDCAILDLACSIFRRAIQHLPIQIWMDPVINLT